MRNDLPPGMGACEIRLQVDDRVEAVVDGGAVFVRTLSGQDARDDGSECNAPLPGREVASFNFEVRERRGDIQLVEGPTRRNGGKVVVRIRDSQGGFGRYVFRINWTVAGAPGPLERRDDRPPDGRGDDRRPPDLRDGDFGRDLHIVKAFWGAPGRSREVTGLVQDRVRDGHLRLQATNEEMGFDPAYQVVKTLVVVYEIGGRRQEVRVAEGGYVDLP